MSGAASYHAQATGRPAVANVHVAPGLGNSLGMLYNALKARAPLVVTAGQQDTRLRLRREVDAAVFRLEEAARAPQEERVPLERARSVSGR